MSIQRQILFMTLVGLLGCEALRAESAQPVAWPLSRGDSAGTGASTTVLPENLEVLWEYELKGLGFDSGPIIADGRVYASDADGHVIGLSLSDGQRLWLEKYDTGFMASPSYDQGVIYVGDLDGIVRALEASTGKLVWQFDAQQEIDAGANFFENSVLVTSQSGSLMALDRQTGNLQWRYETQDQLQCGPTLAGNLTFLGGCDQHLHIVDVRTGQAATERIPIQAPTGSTPSVSDGIVLVPNYKGQIWAFQSPSHQLLWKFEDGQLSSEFKNSVAVAQQTVVAASGNRRLFALDLQSGKVLWQHTLRRRVDGSPVIAGDRVLVAASDGRVIMYDLKTGKEQWVYESKGSFLGSPAVADGKLVTTSDRGTITCFGGK